VQQWLRTTAAGPARQWMRIAAVRPISALKLQASVSRLAGIEAIAAKYNQPLGRRGNGCEYL